MKTQAPMEVERDLATFAQPRISFTSATRARFTWRGQTHIIGTCPMEILQAFLMHHATKARLKADRLNELLELLDYQELGRWQALDTLLLYKTVLPLQY